MLQFLGERKVQRFSSWVSYKIIVRNIGTGGFKEEEEGEIFSLGN